VKRGRRAAVAFIEAQLEAGCSTAASPLQGDDAQGQGVPAHAAPGRDYCPSHQHLERRRSRRARPLGRDVRRDALDPPSRASTDGLLAVG
jgi:hypothetical protein